jgi:predicted lipoprotein with Yx(FWY)xxD motif
MIKAILLLVLCTFTLCVKQESLDRGLKISTHPTLGDYLTDKEGMSLYMFDLDTDFTSNCYDDCTKTWPPYDVDTGVTVFGDIKDTLLGRFQRGDGFNQLTFNKMPLYFYSKDTMSGDVNGHGVMDFGGRWYLMSPSGTPIRRMLSSY